MKPIASGLLNSKVTFQKPVNSDDGYDLETWQDDFTKWARIETGKANESEQSGRLMGEATHKITCHYSSKITAIHRIKHKAKFYQIVGEPINVNFANTVIEIMVKEITDA